MINSRGVQYFIAAILVLLALLFFFGTKKTIYMVCTGIFIATVVGICAYLFTEIMRVVAGGFDITEEDLSHDKEESPVGLRDTSG